MSQIPKSSELLTGLRATTLYFCDATSKSTRAGSSLFCPGWGKWQRQRFALVIAIIWLPGSFHLLNMIFYRAETDFWCKRSTNAQSSKLYYRISSDLTWQNQTITDYFCCRPVNFEDWSVAAWRDLSSPGWNSTNSTLRWNRQNIQLSSLQVAAFASMFPQRAKNRTDGVHVIFEYLI